MEPIPLTVLVLPNLPALKYTYSRAVKYPSSDLYVIEHISERERELIVFFARAVCHKCGTMRITHASFDIRDEASSYPQREREREIEIEATSYLV